MKTVLSQKLYKLDASGGVGKTDFGITLKVMRDGVTVSCGRYRGNYCRNFSNATAVRFGGVIAD
ncbi:hypothetical protein SAMN05518672_1077 [Chitinophaga sp. CF118]|uniref:hypothetical protein n=1 Tax=Chitinophaga sp. CF118 TaxID=1884367 RepID=UPI0008E45525|nr:hypothetical protein [Chitinophaga sp. CF118]SFE49744.1 hypothetical protein SAMN05518672_1077 [Chitinophaga sp. CF118]